MVLKPYGSAVDIKAGAGAFAGDKLVWVVNTHSAAAKVTVAKGHHGQWELQTSSESIAPRKTNVIHLITGEHGDTTVVYTWYPGMMTAPLSAGITDTTPVKLVQKQVAS